MGRLKVLPGKLIFSLLFLFSGLFVFGQHDLSGSRRHSVYTYVYRVSEREAQALYQSGMKGPTEKYLHSLVDSFKEDGSGLSLPPGDYLWVSAAGSKLRTELRTTGDLQYDLINNNHDLAVSLHTREGIGVSEAKVVINKQAVPYDPGTHTYRTSRRKKGGTLQVSYRGALYFFPVTGNSGGYHYPHGFGYSLAHSFPLKYVTAFAKRLFPSSGTYHNRFSDRTDYERRFHSFMVFNKPKYKPGDSVQGKAFILNRRGRPVDRPLRLRVSGYGLQTDTLLELVRPYRSGGYSFSFVLTDSLHLSLDEDYLVTLEESKSRLYNTADYDGDLDEDEYAAKRKVMARGHFKYEDYLLQSIRFIARTDKQENSPGDPVSLYMQATDENELPLPDARVELQVLTSRQADRFHSGNVFVKDTLWTWQQSLDPVGETKVTVPDSIFPAADFSYTIECRLLNSSNESRGQSFRQTYKDEAAKLFFLPRQDSLGVDYRICNNSRPTPSILYAFDKKGDTLGSRPLMLPGVIRMSPYCSRYEVRTGADSVWGQFQTGDQKPRISCVASRTRDSISVEVVNPYHLSFWYTLFAGNKVVERGYSDQLSYNARTTTAKNYFMSLQYAWAGEIGREDYTVPYRDKLLQVAIQEPAFVYPGQTATIGIGVKDAEGRPVAHADLTAYAFTSKFENAPAPWVPYLGKRYPGRKQHANFYPGEEVNRSALTLLNWKRWSREMGLDTLEYYKFLHPASVYINTEPARDRVTQIAPFVSWKGELVPVHLLYIDERPVFFSQAQQLSRYSFYISPGWHSLRLRTPNRMIRLDSLRVQEGVKTFICIDADTANKAAHIEKMPDSLTNQEKALWSRYMILVENNFGEKFASISQDNRVFLLNGHFESASYYSQTFLTGPLMGQVSTLSGDGWQQQFDPEGNQRYLITKGLIKEKQLPGPYPYPFSAYLEPGPPAPDFHDWVLTEQDVDSLWQDYLDDRSARWDLLRNAVQSSYKSGTLQIGFGKRDDGFFVKNLFLFRYDNPDFMQVYKGIDRNLGYLQPGDYRLLVLLKGDHYLIRDSIRILEGGLNYYEIPSSAPHEKDSVSMRIAGIVNSLTKGERTYSSGPELDGVRESFNDKYLNPATFPRLIFGRVMDMDGRPLLSVSVLIKGTHVGVSTDAEGYFRLHTPERGTLVINYIGYTSVERAIGDTAHYEIRLHPVSYALNEVVVVGYGVSRKSDLTASVSTMSLDNGLMGKVAGLQVRLRGAATLGFPPPLVIVDGLPYAGDYSKLDPASIVSIRVLKASEATALYGQNAAGGVILITTKKKGDEGAMPSATAPVAGNMLRRHFRDDAFWQPMLSTDENGMAHFAVTYPDDITNWRTRVLAVGGRRQTGFAEGSVKSFKALSANLAGPSFLVKGDSANVIGKMLNYSPDTVMVQRIWSIDDKEVVIAPVELTNARVETLPVGVGAGDSIKLKYTLLKKDGYFDGEERVIPVYRRGVKETKGVFSALEEDTSFTLSFDPALGPVQVYAESSVLPVLLDEIESIKNYEYLCNEQLASKLGALLEKKKIFQFQGKEFREDKNIRELISRLMLARGAGGLWGWWSHNEPALWISLHVSEALLEADKAGYKTNLNRQLLQDYLVYSLESYTTIDRIHAIRLLQELDARVDYKRYIDSAERQLMGRERGAAALERAGAGGERSGGAARHVSLYERLKLLEVKQEAGIAIRLDTLIARHGVTVMGNWYWGEDTRSFFDNAFQNTLLMYRLLRRAGGHAEILRKARNYFLEKRKDGHWRNTYESSLVLETILPDLLEGGGGEGSGRDAAGRGRTEGRMEGAGLADTLTLNGGVPVTVFPYKTILPVGNRVTLNKKGRLPVYFTAFQQFWNEIPEKVSGVFGVHSIFEKEGGEPVAGGIARTGASGGLPLSMGRLKAGEAVVLKTKISVEADADYVLIEIPIPAGCTYREKEQAYYNNEVHREYYKNKVSIFCRSLSKGEYVFTVSLLPRYTGRYQLNPARAEMMYFPVFYGREGMKEVDIY
ncbi:MAG TPA: alpha-2-macroglobulin family protein [Puia sp.]|nr:alpha-2-macroglobulin family protein [Puia sp.]